MHIVYIVVVIPQFDPGRDADADWKKQDEKTTYCCGHYYVGITTLGIEIFNPKQDLIKLKYST